MNIISSPASHNVYFTLNELLDDQLDTQENTLDDIEEIYQIYKDELNSESKTTDKVWLEFHAGLCRHFGRAAKFILYKIVKSSVNNQDNNVAAANAITILKVMKVSFSCLDLRGVQIPGADLSSAIFDGADVSDANLERANLTYASLNGTNMSKTDLKNVLLDIPNILIHEDKVRSSIVSPDNQHLVSQDTKYMYFWNLPTKSCIKKIAHSYHYKPLSDRSFKEKKIFTPDGQFLFTYDFKHQHIDIWSVGNFEHIKKLEIINEEATDIYFSFSPHSTHLITYNLSKAKTHLKIWEIQKIDTKNLDINLKNEATVPYEIGNIIFSKKFPIFYCFKIEHNEPDIKIGLCIWDIEKFSEIASFSSIDESNNFISLRRFSYARNSGWLNEYFSLDILDTNNHDEELLFIAFGTSIYSVHILNKSDQNYPLNITQAKKLQQISILFIMYI